MRWTVPIVLLALLCCGFAAQQEGNRGLTETNGVLSCNGTKLPFHRWVVVPVEGIAPDSVTFETGTGEIGLLGGEALHVEVDLYSEVEGDGSVVLRDGRPFASSTSGRIVVINGVRGTLPSGVSVHARSGTGALRLEGLREARVLRLDGGTGVARLADTKAAELHAKCGTGELQLQGCTLEKLVAAMGTGHVQARQTHVRVTEVKSGTGDVVVSTDSDLGKAEYELGTGKVRRGG